jgi:hypothetical protein
MTWFEQKALRAEVIKAAEFIRSELERHDADGRFTLRMVVEGSADRKDATLKFEFDMNRNYGTSVSSPNLSDAVGELLRRMGFDKLHSAELLTFDPAEADRLAVLQTPVAAPPQPQE